MTENVDGNYENDRTLAVEKERVILVISFSFF